MPHLRNRDIAPLLKKYASYWPVVGVLGPRQSGKSTLFRDILDLGTYVTLDDTDAQDDARHSAKNFLEKLPRPLVIDEVQRVPPLFDAIKLIVDKKRQPGRFFLTGSSKFSAKLGIRESLTGRIGILYLYPLTLAEAANKTLQIKRANPFHTLPLRFSNSDALKTLESGALPGPLFTRESALVRSYFQNWLETTLYRDASRAYGKGYDPDVAYSIVTQMALALKEGEYATLKHFREDSRKVRRYLQALEDIFLVQKIIPSRKTSGNDQWTFFDTGVAAYLMGGILGEGVHLSLMRIFILKEVRALLEYSNRRIRLEYYKTTRSAPVDFIWDEIPVKISVASTKQLEYDFRPLRSAMAKLGSKRGILMHGREKVEKEAGIWTVPWVQFS